MRHYSNLQPFWMSFYAGELYEDVGRNWTGTGFGYLFMLLVITWVPIVYSISSRFDVWVDTNLPEIIEQAPELKIENGKLSINPNKPFIIDDPDTKKPLIIIDVSGEYTSLDDTEAQFLVLEDKILVRGDTGNIQEVPVFEDVAETVVFNEDTLFDIAEFFKALLPFALYPIAVVVSFIYRIIQVLIYGAIGILFAQYVNTELEYETLIRLASICVTPVVMLDTAYILMDVSLDYWWFFCFLISMGYLYFAVKVNGLAETEALARAHEEEPQ